MKASKDVQARLANRLILSRDSEWLPTVRELAQELDLSTGSISYGLKSLHERGAISIESRGRSGTQIKSLSIPHLWRMIEPGPLVISLTLPMHSRYEGLAAGITSELRDAGIETYLVFGRGSHRRLQALDEGRCHACVMSAFAAGRLCGPGHEVLLTLPRSSWISEYVVFYRNRRALDRTPLRVAVDRDSYDHSRLTQLEFKDRRIEYIHASYVHVLRLLQAGRADATVWTVDSAHSFEAVGINHRQLSDHVKQAITDESLQAAFVGAKGHHSLRMLLRSSISGERVLAIQRKVVEGSLIPEY